MPSITEKSLLEPSEYPGEVKSMLSSDSRLVGLVKFVPPPENYFTKKYTYFDLLMFVFQ
jgi:hypothetical protein